MYPPNFQYQVEFDNYCTQALQALGSGQYITPEVRNNILHIGVMNRPTGLRWIVRMLFPCFFSHEIFENVSRLMMMVLERNQNFLKGHSAELLQLKGRWSKKSPAIGQRLQTLINHAVELENPQAQIRLQIQTAERQLQLTQAELQRLQENKQELMSAVEFNALSVERRAAERVNAIEASSKPAPSAPKILDSIAKLEPDCFLMSSELIKVPAHTAFLRNFEFFDARFGGNFKHANLPQVDEAESKKNVSLGGLEEDVKEAEDKYGLEVELKEVDANKQTPIIDLSGTPIHANDRPPGFTQCTIEHFLYYVHTGTIEPTCSTVESISKLLLLADFISSDQLRNDCLAAMDKIFEGNTFEFNIGFIFNPPEANDLLEDYFAQRYLLQLYSLSKTIKKRVSPEMQQKLFQLFEKRLQTAKEVESKVLNDDFSLDKVKETRWDCTKDRISIYSYLIGLCQSYGLGTEINKDISRNNLYEAIKRNYAPGLATSLCIPSINKDEAVKNIKRAIELNFELAYVNLGNYYIANKKMKKAFVAFKKAADKGVIGGYWGMYVLTKVEYYCELCAEKGRHIAMYEMAKIAKTKGQRGLALRWAIVAREAGSPDAQALIDQINALPQPAMNEFLLTLC